eukprot:scaffold11182_cov122-Isochrysis_galbana.AAC.5
MGHQQSWRGCSTAGQRSGYAWRVGPRPVRGEPRGLHGKRRRVGLICVRAHGYSNSRKRRMPRLRSESDAVHACRRPPHAPWPWPAADGRANGPMAPGASAPQPRPSTAIANTLLAIRLVLPHRIAANTIIKYIKAMLIVASLRASGRC